MHVMHVVEGRPDLLKSASLVEAFSRAPDVRQTLVRTAGRRGAPAAPDDADPDLPEPDLDLGVGHGSGEGRTARVMMALEPVLRRHAPDWVFTGGDSDATLAAALAGRRAGVRVARTEAGLRSFDRSAPAEVNRVLSDAVADALFTTEPAAGEHLLAEGVAPDRIHEVGSLTVGVVDRYMDRVRELRIAESLGLDAGRYVVAALRSPANVDEPERLSALLRSLAEVSYETELPVVLPLHPRTAERIHRYDLDAALASIHPLAPLDFLEFLGLAREAGALVTDSGPVQEEASVLGVPCVTLGSRTERPLTVEEGTNRLHDGDPDGLADTVREALLAERRPCRPRLWDGRAAERIARVTLAGAGGTGVSSFPSSSSRGAPARAR